MLRPLDRAGRDDGRAEERGGGEVAADFLENKRRFGRSEAEATVAFGNADAGEAELGELLPQSMTETVLAGDVAPVPKLLCDTSFLGKEARRRLLKHLLVVVEQAHAPGSRRMCLATMLSWISLVPPSI